MNQHKINDASFGITVNFFSEDILKALKSIYINAGTPVSPIQIDSFVSSEIAGIREIPAGSMVTIALSENSTSLNARLIYVEIKNMSPNHNGFMTQEMWECYFEFENDGSVVVAPNGCMYINPSSEGSVQMATKKIDSADEEIIISYSLMVCFALNNRMYYCRIDPLAKVTSGSK